MPSKPKAPQDDFWAGTTAPPQGSQQQSAAPASSNDDWKIWQAKDAPTQPANPGFFGPIQDVYDQYTAPTKGDSAVGNAFANFGRGVMEVAQPLMHPIKTAEAMAPKSFGEGALNAALGPAAMLRPMVSGAVQDVKQNGLAEAVPHIAGQFGGSVLVGEGLGAAKMPNIYPKSQSLAPTEIGARNLARALVIPEAAHKSFIPAAAQEAGTVLDYAKRSGIPINGTADFVKASQGATKEIRDFLDNQIVQPNANKPVSVAGTGFRGKTFGEGPNTTVGELYKRINQINAELNPNYRKGLASQTSAANVSDADLLAEKQALTPKLHSSLAQFTGLTPEDIAELRTRSGKLSTIADEAGLADATNLKATGNAALNRSPLGSGGKLSIIDKAMTKLQGGPEIIGNRELLKALKSIQPTSRPLPSLAPPVETVTPRTPITGGSTPVQTFAPDISGADSVFQKLMDRQRMNEDATNLSDGLAWANKNLANDEVLRAHTLEQQAQSAADQRASRASLLRDSIRHNGAMSVPSYEDMLAMRRGIPLNAISPSSRSIEEFLQSARIPVPKSRQAALGIVDKMARERYGNAVQEYSALPEKIDGYRAVRVGSLDDLNKEDLGRYWSSREDGAQDYHADQRKPGQTVILKAAIDKNSLDVPRTLLARMRTATGFDEAELNLKDGEKPSNVYYKIAGENEWKPLSSNKPKR